jgi:hypothetical protein
MKGAGGQARPGTLVGIVTGENLPEVILIRRALDHARPR